MCIRDRVYLVCPAIEDTPDGGLNAVKTYYEDIAKALLPERRVGLMHGKLKPKEKAAVMEDFKAGRLDAQMCIRDSHCHALTVASGLGRDLRRANQQHPACLLYTSKCSLRPTRTG